ncbi:type II secretion system protein GspD [Cyanobium sp. LEGE 06113]|uniref:type II secretion system protein GspD n=1 Tax=Cyanobium sp. LEGE 06113 TaxID=1297573 RepID=UPI001882C395|nr:general secretion pathway protein D [Cyanobium sp. LEGE 06113]MBE9154376.1 general secretion pathway protein D [Cyanobium sp. LEGE 06113]
MVVLRGTRLGPAAGKTCWPLILASGCLTPLLLQTAAGSAPRVPSAGTIPPAEELTGAVQLKVRRLPDTVELVIEGTGISPQLQQNSDGAGWQGQLFTAEPAALMVGPQRLSLPEVGFQAINFDGGGTSFSISVTPMPGVTLGRPVVSADGRSLILSFPSPEPQASLQVNSFNLASLGAVPLPTYAPPLQPRAVAPPLGDMAVGTMTLRNPGFVNVSGPPVTMTLKNAPARDALMALASLGGYGFAYVDEPSVAAAPAGAPPNQNNRPLSIAFRGESYARALNTTLLAAGLQGKLEGNMILAGPNALSKSFGAQVSKVYRLNQVGPNAAADYLANLGATVTKTNTVTTSVTQGVTQADAISSAPNAQTTQASLIKTVEAFGATTGPLIGLRATTDTRLGTITMVGDPSVVAIGEQYLRQLDLRQRQVALNVRILDVNLENEASIDNSFAFRFGNNFIVNDNGQLLGAFGRFLPPGEADFAQTETVTRNSSNSLAITRGLGRTLTNSQLRDVNRALSSETGSRLVEQDGQFIVEPINNSTNLSSDSLQRNVNRVLSRTLGRNVETSTISSSTFTGTRRINPGTNYPADTFFDFVRAQIVSGSTKLLASPTLILQENPSLLREGNEMSSGTNSDEVRQGIREFGVDSPIGRRRANEGVVRVGTNVVTSYETETPAQGGNVVCTPGLATAGLVLGARVEKIDDNGFITFVLSPSVSAVTDREPAPAGCGSDLNILSIRSLDTGALRVRDGQTLILTGVISDFDRSVVSKWPILGDIPLIGQFFRSTGNQKEKRELVIMVTPRIINDETGGTFGYGYQPGTRQGREFLGNGDF